MSSESRSTVSGSVFRALALLEFILGADTPPTTRELGQHFGIPPSSLAALLSALRGEGYLVSTGGSITPGPRLMALGQLACRHEIVVDIRTALRLLVDRTGETAFYSVEVPGPAGELGSVLPVEQIESPDEIRYVGILGRPRPLLQSMAGRVILAFSAREADLRALLSRQDGPGHADRVLSELNEIRRTGLARYTTRPSDRIGTTTVAAPVLQNGRTIGALSIAGPSARIDALADDLRTIFRDAQDVIEHKHPAGPSRRSVRWRPAAGDAADDE